MRCKLLLPGIKHQKTKLSRVPQENHKITSVCQQRMSLCNKEEKKDAPVDILGSRPSLLSSNSLAAMSIAFFLVTCIFLYGESLLQSNINKFINFHVDNHRWKNYKKERWICGTSEKSTSTKMCGILPSFCVQKTSLSGLSPDYLIALLQTA